MKIILIIIFFNLFAATSPALFAQEMGSRQKPENLLKYGGFERLNNYVSPFMNYQLAKPFYGWDCVGNWLNNINVGRDAIEGNACVVITSPCWLTKGIVLDPGVKYQISGYIKTALQKMPIASKLGAYFEVSAGHKILFKKTLSGIQDWTYLAGTFKTPSNNKSVKIKIGIKTTSGTAFFDGFEINRVKTEN